MERGERLPLNQFSDSSCTRVGGEGQSLLCTVYNVYRSTILVYNSSVSLFTPPPAASSSNKIAARTTRQHVAPPRTRDTHLVEGRVGEQLLDFLVRDRRVHDHVVTLVPVHRRRHPVLVAELQGCRHSLVSSQPVNHSLTVNHTILGQRGVESKQNTTLTG